MEKVFNELVVGFLSYARACARIYSSAVAMVAVALVLFSAAASFAAPLTFSQASSDLKSSDLRRRYMAIQALKNFADQGAAPMVAGALRGEKNIEFRLAMLDTLASLQDSSVIAAIAPLTTHPNAMLRQRAVYTIGLLGGRQAETVLANTLAQDSDIRVRTTALQGLAVCGSAKSLPAIQSALEDSKPDVRAHAIEALRAIPGTASMQALQNHQESDTNLKRRIQKAIHDKQSEVVKP